MFCCFRPSAIQQDGEEKAPAGSTAVANKQNSSATESASQSKPAAKAPAGRRSNSLGSRSGSTTQQSTDLSLQQQQHASGRSGPASATQAAGPAAQDSGQVADSTPIDDSVAGQQGGVLQLVALLQELLALSTASPRQPLSKAMGLLVLRLPVDWACLHAMSLSGQVVLQVGAALSPEAQRQRGASGSFSYATPIHSTPVRRYNQMMQGSQGAALQVTPSAAGAAGSGVQEVGAGHLQLLPGSDSSLELVAHSRQALAMYAGDELEAASLPKDWQRLHKDRDLRSFLAVPIIASGGSGCIIGTLSFGLTSVLDWGSAWWMSSIQLLCGWAAGALPQNRGTARACFFDALWSATDLDSLGSVFVHQLPHALVDTNVSQLEVRLALVSSRLANCVIYASQADTPDSAGEPHQQYQQPQQQHRHSQQELLHSQPQKQPEEQPQQDQQQVQGIEPQQQVMKHRSTGVPEDVKLAAAVGDAVANAPGFAAGTCGSLTSISRGIGCSSGLEELLAGGGSMVQQLDGCAAQAAHKQQPVARFSLATASTVLLSALEWGEVMIVKDTVTYFGRSAGSGAVRDLFLPDRPMVRGTLVLLPLLYRCRPLGCVYLLAAWDIHASLSKAALQEMASLLAAGTFKALVSGGSLQQEWYSNILAEQSASGQVEAAVEPAAVVNSRLNSAKQQDQGGDSSTPAAGQQGQQQQQQHAGSATKRVARATSWSPGAEGTAGSTEGQPGLRPSTSLDSLAAAAAPAAAASTAVECTLAAGAVSCSLPCTAAEAARAAAAVAPAGVAASGHACSEFPELVLWPELLEFKEDLARSRHSVVYTVEHSSHIFAVKLFRYSSSIDQGHQAPLAVAGGAAGPAGGGASSSTLPGNALSTAYQRESELEAVLSLQYRLCDLRHEHILQHVAVYPKVYEVVHRRSSREPPDVYLTSSLPRKDRHHRCAALVTEYAAGGCLRDAVNRGAVHVPTPLALKAAAAAAGLDPSADLPALDDNQMQFLLAQLEQQMPPPQLQQVRGPPSADAVHMSAPLPVTQNSATGSVGKRRSSELQTDGLREPYMPLLRQLLLQIALGMQHLHAHGIVHGELRLDNVMIAGALPTPFELLQQQRQQQHMLHMSGLSLPEDQQQQQQQQFLPATAVIAASLDSLDHVGRAGGSSLSLDASLKSFTSQRGHSSTGSVGFSVDSNAHGPGLGFHLKVKDIGLCTVGWSHRQVTMRKLAGRQRLQAVTWLAPECFKGEGLSKHSDVYSFGILMWELYTGQVAFNDLVTGSVKVLQTIITDGVRPQFPDGAPPWYVTLASRCWSGTAKNRPSFRRIVAQLQALERAQAPLLQEVQQQQQQQQEEEVQRKNQLEQGQSQQCQRDCPVTACEVSASL